MQVNKYENVEVKYKNTYLMMFDKVWQRWVSNTIGSKKPVTTSSGINKTMLDLGQNLAMKVIGTRAKVRHNIAPDTLTYTD